MSVAVSVWQRGRRSGGEKFQALLCQKDESFMTGRGTGGHMGVV